MVRMITPKIRAAAVTTVTNDLNVMFKSVTALGTGKKNSKIIKMPKMAVK